MYGSRELIKLLRMTEAIEVSFKESAIKAIRAILFNWREMRSASVSLVL